LDSKVLNACFWLRPEIKISTGVEFLNTHVNLCEVKMIAVEIVRVFAGIASTSEGSAAYTLFSFIKITNLVTISCQLYWNTFWKNWLKKNVQIPILLDEQGVEK